MINELQSNKTLDDKAACYAAMQARDYRFDGVFFVAVSTTKIYCRPICRVRLPKLERCTFYANAAQAEQAGYRPCLRCRPELAPGQAQMDTVKRVAQLAAMRIKAGALSELSVQALADEFEISERQLRRSIETEFGVSPLQLALSYRLLLAKQLLTDTTLSITDIAFTSGFSSVRRFNDAFKKHYRLNPREIRKPSLAIQKKSKKNSIAKSFKHAGSIELKLSYRPPMPWESLIRYLCSRGNSRIDSLQAQNGKLIYYKTVSIAAYDEAISTSKDQCLTGWFAARHDEKRQHIIVELSQSLIPHFIAIQKKLRDLFDLDANPLVIDSHLSRDRLLKEIIKKQSGTRVAGTLDPFELALRAVLGQQISVKAATTVFGRFVDRFGDDVETPIDDLDKTAPNPYKIADASLDEIMALGLTTKRAETVKTLALATVDGTIPWQTHQQDLILNALLNLRGIGPWTAQYIAMRALRDPNAFPESDLGLMKALKVEKPKAVLERAKKWSPWRAYAAMYLWMHLNSEG